MAVTNYYSLNGRIIAEDTSGARTDYLRDALGSVVATTDQNQNVTTTARYAAYGTPFETTGNYSNLRFGWCGSWGYRKTQRSWTGLPQSETYVRARHYSQTASRWTGVDPLWPTMQAVGYSRQNPTRIVDPTGATPWFTSDSGCDSALQQSVQGCCDKLNQTLSQPGAAIIAAGGVMLPGFLSWYLLSCMHKKGFTKKPMSLRQAVEAVGNWADLCRSNSGKLNNVCIYCNWGPDRRAYPPECDPCKNAGSVANTPVPRSGNPKISSKNTDCNVFYQSPTDPCDDLLDQEHCDAVIVLCDHYQDPSQRNDICSTLYHEMIHAGGLMGPPFHEDATPAVRKHDFVYALACCICEAVYGEGASECTDCDAWRAKD